MYINLKKSYNINVHKTSCVLTLITICIMCENRRGLISSPILFEKINKERKDIKIINKEGRLKNEIK